MLRETVLGKLIGLVRRYVYAHGQPPPGWSTARDASILKSVLRYRSPQEIQWAIIGLGLLGEAHDLRPLQWRTPGRNPMFDDAVRAFWQSQKKSRPLAPNVKAILREMVQ